MPRPKRPNWSRITITISEEVAHEIRVLAAEMDEEMGTLVDQTLRDHRPVPPALDRSFAEELIILLQNRLEEATRLPLETFAEKMNGVGLTFQDPDGVLGWMSKESLEELFSIWQNEGRVQQPYKWAFFRAFTEQGWVPTIKKMGLVHEEWFSRGFHPGRFGL